MDLTAEPAPTKCRTYLIPILKLIENRKQKFSLRSLRFCGQSINPGMSPQAIFPWLV